MRIVGGDPQLPVPVLVRVPGTVRTIYTSSMADAEHEAACGVRSPSGGRWRCACRTGTHIVLNLVPVPIPEGESVQRTQLYFEAAAVPGYR